MKNIKIIQVNIEGFGSIATPLKFNLQDRGTSIIRGYNGVGKTTVFNAIYWCLFGKHIKDVAKANISTFKELRPKNYRGTRVIVTLTVDGELYKIIRTIKYTPATKQEFLTKGDTLNILTAKGWETSKLYIKHQQQYIDSILGMDSKTFINSILFGQRMKRLISSNAADKRDLLERLFNTSFTSKARDKAKDELGTLRNKDNSLEYKLAGAKARLGNLNNKLATHKEYLDKFNTNKVYKLDKLQVELSDTTTAIKKLTARILKQEGLVDDTAGAQLKKLRLEHKELRKTKDTLARDIDRLEADIHNTGNDIAHYSNNLKFCTEEKDKIQLVTNCGICGKELTNEQAAVKLQEIGLRIEEYSSKITKLQDKKEDLEHKLEADSTELQGILLGTLEPLKAKIAVLEGASNEEAIKEIPVLKERLTNLTNLEDRVNQQLLELKAQQPTTIDTGDVAKEISKVTLEIDTLLDEQDTVAKAIQAYTFWVKKGFSSSGIKAYVFSSMLERLNHYITKYANSLGLGVRFSIDLTKASKPFTIEVHKANILRPYNTLSGGEQQLVDVIIAFSLHDLVSANTDIDILIFDEVFEGLDKANEGKIFDFMRLKAEGNKNLFIISHNDNLNSMYCKILEFKAVTGGIKIVE